MSVRSTASGTAPAIVVGDMALAAKQGINLTKLDRDGFVIRTSGNQVLIIGRDDPKLDPRRTTVMPGMKGEFATLFGAYDFLERFAGVRYYFPGEIGIP